MSDSIKIWGSALIVLGLMVFGLVKFADNDTPNDSIGDSGIAEDVALDFSLDGDSHLRGGIDAPVIITEFSDFQCPACSAYEPIVTKLSKEFPDDVVVEYRHFPLNQIHPFADLAARASEAAGLQGKFFEMHDLLFDGQGDWSKSRDPESVFVGYAKDLDLDTDKFIVDLDSDEVAAMVEEDLDVADRLHLGGTPSFFINGKQLELPQGFEPFKALVEAELDSINSGVVVDESEAVDGDGDDVNSDEDVDLEAKDDDGVDNEDELDTDK